MRPLPRMRAGALPRRVRAGAGAVGRGGGGSGGGRRGGGLRGSARGHGVLPPPAAGAGELAGLLAPCLEPSTAFSAATVAAVAAYSAAVALPRWPAVRGVFLASPPLYAAGTALAVGVAAAAGRNLVWVWPILRQGLAPSLASISAALADPPLVAFVWVQLLLMDLVMARHVHKDGLRAGVPTQHSLILCFMVGPLGILSHLLTFALWRQKERWVGA